MRIYLQLFSDPKRILLGDVARKSVGVTGRIDAVPWFNWSSFVARWWYCYLVFAYGWER